MYKKTTLQVYALSCCFVSMIFIIISFYQILSNLINLSFTEIKYSTDLIKFESSEKFSQLSYNKYGEYINSLPEEEKLYFITQEKDYFIKTRKMISLEYIMNYIPWFLSGIILFFINWRINKKISNI